MKSFWLILFFLVVTKCSDILLFESECVEVFVRADVYSFVWIAKKKENQSCINDSGVDFEPYRIKWANKNSFFTSYNFEEEFITTHMDVILRVESERLQSKTYDLELNGFCSYPVLHSTSNSEVFRNEYSCSEGDLEVICDGGISSDSFCESDSSDGFKSEARCISNLVDLSNSLIRQDYFTCSVENVLWNSDYKKFSCDCSEGCRSNARIGDMDWGLRRSVYIHDFDDYDLECRCVSDSIELSSSIITYNVKQCDALPVVSFIPKLGSCTVLVECGSDEFGFIDGYEREMTVTEGGFYEFEAMCIAQDIIPSKSTQSFSFSVANGPLVYCSQNNLGSLCRLGCPELIEDLTVDPPSISETFAKQFVESGELHARCVSVGCAKSDEVIQAVIVGLPLEPPKFESIPVIGGLDVQIFCNGNGEVCDKNGSNLGSYNKYTEVGIYSGSYYCCKLGYQLSEELKVQIEVTQLDAPTVNCSDIVGGIECQWSCANGYIEYEDATKILIYNEENAYTVSNKCKMKGFVDSSETSISFNVAKVNSPLIECNDVLGGKSCTWSCPGEIYINGLLVDKTMLVTEEGSYSYEAVCRSIGKAESVPTSLSFNRLLFYHIQGIIP
eukprot:TRINITY_DN132499_c0_g1_i4.p1 TRINITY_DN132499_c0_g1~~TRINITY_DN132499_c0_g1_i4.p1  ORF type:complete len:614 (+),score=76.23 TRINITY_DN132499_c0_g1_i4:117-1958(+)